MDPLQIAKDMDFFPSRDQKLLQEFLNSHPERIEVEVRLGKFQKGFQPGVRENDFNYVKNALSRMSVQKGGTLEVSTSNIKTYPSGVYMKNEDLTKKNNPPFYGKKEKKAVIDIHSWGYRIAKAYEENISPENVKDIEFPTDTFRIKRRTSFIDRDENGPLYGVTIDLTIVTHFDRGEAYETFEIEVERKIRLSADKFISRFMFIYFIYQRLDSIYFDYYYNNLKESENAIFLMTVHFALCMKTKERYDAIAKFNSIFKNKSKDKLVMYRNEAINIKLDNLFSPYDYAVTAKLDGVRKFLFIDRDAVYLINPPYEIIKLSDRKEIETDFNGTIIDGEFVVKAPHTHYGFDILYFKGKNVTKDNLLKRLEMVRAITNKRLNIENSIQLKAKEFHHTGDFYENVKKALEDNKVFETTHPYRRTDGLIIQPIKEPYINKSTHKWKPVEELTIDFRVTRTETPNEFNLEAFYTKEKTVKYQLFKGTVVQPYDKTVHFKDALFENEEVFGRIIEFKWNSKSYNFEPVRYRNDRPLPNKMNVAISVWKDIHNPIYESTIRGDDLVVMRKYHNQIKNHLLQKFSRRGDKVLDIGSGRGGDLSKWKKLSLEVYAVEPDRENILEFKRRQVALDVKDVEVIHAKAEDTLTIQKKVDKVDIITAFFSLTYFPENEKDIKPNEIKGKYVTYSPLDNGTFTLIKTTDTVLEPPPSNYCIIL